MIDEELRRSLREPDAAQNVKLDGLLTRLGVRQAVLSELCKVFSNVGDAMLLKCEKDAKELAHRYPLGQLARLNGYTTRTGHPLLFREWMHLIENLWYKRVALSSGEDWRVSTVWIGLNQPEIGMLPYETQVTIGSGQTERRSASETDAIHYHLVCVAAARLGAAMP